MTEAIDACLDPDPEERPLASELERVLAAHAPSSTASRCPRRRHRWRGACEPRRRPDLARFLPGARGRRARPRGPDRDRGPGPDRCWPRSAPGVLAIGRPRPAFALQLALVVLWLADRRGRARGRRSGRRPRRPAAARRRSTRGDRRSPGSRRPRPDRPGPVYPALAGLTRGAAGRALLGGDRLPLARGLGGARAPHAPARAGRRPARRTGRGRRAPPSATWSLRCSTARSSPPRGSAPLAALVLPLLVRGRTPVLDALGALIWAAGLISALRLVAGGAEPARAALRGPARRPWSPPCSRGGWEPRRTA